PVVHPVAAEWQGCASGGGLDAVHGGEDPAGVAAQAVGGVAGGRPGGPAGEGVPVGRLRAAQQTGAVVVGGDDPVEDDPVGAVGEQGGVHLAEVGAVGVSEVGDLPLAECGSDDVQVPGGVPGGDIRQDVAGGGP